MRVERTAPDPTLIRPEMENTQTWVAFADDGSVAVRASLTTWNGMRWACVSFEQLPAGVAMRTVLLIKRILMTRDEPLYALVDATTTPTAERLNTLLGLRDTGNRIDLQDRSFKVWLWQKHKH